MNVQKPFASLGPPSSAGPRPNSVNLGPHALVAFLDTLDGPAAQTPANVKRDFVRWPFRRLAVEMGVVNGSRDEARRFKVASRNLSNGGICVLHNNYMHLGTQCFVSLPHPTRGHVQIRGKVMRCMHRTGVVHEIGIAFERPIAANEFILHDPLSNSFSTERVKPADLAGRVLLVEPSKPDRDAIAHFLRETSLALTSVTSLTEAIGNCERIDLVLLSSQVSDSTAVEAAAKLRATGVSGPLVMLLPDDSARTREAVRDADVDQFVVRPLTEDLLLRALGDVLLGGRARVRSAMGGLPGAGPSSSAVSGSGGPTGSAAGAKPHAA